MTKNAQLILASASPRRQQLLREEGIRFTAETPKVEELNAENHPEKSAYELARINASQKAKNVATKHASECVLAADTVVVCNGRIMGKPKDTADAKKMLQSMSGQVHEVLTAVVLLCLDKKIEREHVERSQVVFRTLDEKTIDSYLKVVNVIDKAGAYALQEYGKMLVERVEGSRTNVIGLPMEIVKQWLDENL